LSAPATRHRVAYTARLPEPIERLARALRCNAHRACGLARLDAGRGAGRDARHAATATTIQSLPASLRIIASYSVGTITSTSLPRPRARAAGHEHTGCADRCDADVAMPLILSACRQASSAERELAPELARLSMADERH
jgi:hypothetical protein